MVNLSIYIDGTPIDIATGGDMTFTFQSMRFCGNAIPDGISVDITLPDTVNNRTLLGVSGELYQDLAGDTRGEIVTPSFRRECRVSVKSVTRDGITVAVFIFTVPSGMADRTLWRLKHDDQSTIFDWKTAAAAKYGDWPYYIAEEGKALGCYARHPFLTWGVWLKQAIEDECGCVIDDTVAVNAYHDFLDIGVVADGKRLCPENPTQCLQVSFKNGETDGYISGGQHAVNDLECGGLFSWYEDQLGVFPNGWLWNTSGIRTAAERDYTDLPRVVTFDRGCAATIIIRGINDWTGDVSVNVGGTTYTPSFNWESGNYYKATLAVSVQAGDTMTFATVGTIEDDLLVKIDYTGYTIEEGDYDRVLAYMPADISFTMGTDPDEPDWTGWSYSYFGFWANMPKRTVRSLLTTLAWLTGCGLDVSGNTVTFGALDASIVEVRQRLIDTVSLEGGTFGRNNIVKWRDSDQYAIQWSGDVGDDEVVVFESDFMTVLAGRRVDDWVIPIYTLQYGDGNQHDWPVQYSNLGGVLGVLDFRDDPSVMGVKPCGRLSAMGLDSISGNVEVEGMTTDDNITAANELNAEGVRLAVKEIVYNAASGVFTYTAVRL